MFDERRAAVAHLMIGKNIGYLAREHNPKNCFRRRSAI
jgi:hypothetical protein